MNLRINEILTTTLLTASIFLAGCSDNADQGMTTTTAAPAAVSDPKAITGYSAEQVAANTYVIHGPRELPNVGNKGFMNNPAFITTPDGVVVIDPGSSVYTGQMVLGEIRKVTDAPVIVVFNTHIHGDHWLGNDAFDDINPNLAIFGHQKMIAKIDEGAGQDWVDLLSNLTEGATDGTAIIKPNSLAKHDDKITIGGHDFVIIHNGKAHTETDIMIHYLQDNVLFTGDNAGNERILRIDHGSYKGNIDVLQLGLDRKPAKVVPGHGMTGGTEVLEAYRHYLQTIYDKVTAGYEEDLSDFEIKPEIEAALADYKDWPGFEEELGKHISNTYLEIEAADF